MRTDRSVDHHQFTSNGAVLRNARVTAGLSQAELGRRTSYSAATISRFETGRRALTDVHVLRTFSAALSLPPGAFGLTDTSAIRVHHGAVGIGFAGDTVRVGRVPTGEGGADSVERREVLAGLIGLTGAAVLGRPGSAAADARSADRLAILLLGPADDGTAVDLGELTRRMSRARLLFDDCRFRRLEQVLPSLLGVATATCSVTTARSHEVASRLLSDGYRLAAQLAVKRGEDGLALLAGDRARTAARASGDAASVAAATRSTAIALRRLGHRDSAVRLLTRTASDLHGAGATRSVADATAYCGLLSTAAYSLAQEGLHSSALEAIGEAHDIADRAGRTDQRALGLRASTTIYRVGIHVALGDSGTALGHASRLDLRQLPTPERRARLLGDTARAWAMHGRVDRAYACLSAAERDAPEDVRRRSVLTLVRELLAAPGPHPAGLRAMAGRVGAV